MDKIPRPIRRCAIVDDMVLRKRHVSFGEHAMHAVGIVVVLREILRPCADKYKALPRRKFLTKDISDLIREVTGRKTAEKTDQFRVHDSIIENPIHYQLTFV